MGFRWVEHTADMAVELTGETPKELCEAACSALWDALADGQEVPGLQPASVNIVIGDSLLEGVLVNLLNEIIYLFETRGLLPSADALVESMTLDHSDSTWTVRIQGAAAGWKLPADFHPETDVKAATWHGLKVGKNADGKWTATVVMDL